MNFKCLKDHIEMTTQYKSMNILKINDVYELKVAKYILYNLYIFVVKKDFLKTSTCPLNQLINSTIIKQDLSQIRTIIYQDSNTTTY